MKYTIITLLLFLFFSCQSENKTAPPPEKPKGDIYKKKTTPPPPPPTIEDKRWDAFWTKFTKAVEADDAETVADLCHLPLKGAEPMFGGKALTRKNLILNFPKLFDKEAKETIATTTSNMADFEVKKVKTAKKLNVPVNTKVRSIQVLYITDKGTERQTESSVIYHFAKIENEYKLVSLMMAG